MANKYLKRRFTLRETILLGVLLVVLLLGLYFGLVFYPIQSRTADVDAQLEVVAQQKDDAMDDKREYDRMKAELARIEESGDTTVMPKHSGAHYLELLDKINQILEGIDHPVPNNISEPREGIVTRTISLTFTVTEANKGSSPTVYDKVHSVLTELITTGYRCSMQRLTLQPGDAGVQGSTSVTVSVVIEFFELAE